MQLVLSGIIIISFNLCLKGMSFINVTSFSLKGNVSKFQRLNADTVSKTLPFNSALTKYTNKCSPVAEMGDRLATTGLPPYQVAS